MNKVIIIVVALLLIGGGAFYFFASNREVAEQQPETTQQPQDDVRQTTVVIPDENEEEINDEPTTFIGTSAGGRDITAYHFGEGDTEIVFISGMHGAYSWNTVALGYELVDYFEENAGDIPANLRVTVIPVLNPDGLFAVTGKLGRITASDIPSTVDATIPGRFNDNDVDLNRNFDCQWQEAGTWQTRTVSGGSEPFSEPEAVAVRDFVNDREPAAIVTYYSAAGGVFASNCNNGVLPETTTLTNLYADAAGYQAYEEFDFYEITGDMVNWFAKQDIPAISVLLSNHSDVEWSKNRAGVEAVLEYYAE